MLNTEAGCRLAARKCKEIKIQLETFERLIEAELDQQGKKRKAGLWDEFDKILDEAADEETSA
jgi:hypothetical protein